MKTIHKIFSSIIIIIVLMLGVVGFAFYVKQLQPNQHQVACTMEGKVCPDGTVVGRTGPDCEFAACPPIKGKTFGTQITLGIGEGTTFEDGLVVALKSINDSRCKEGVVCIWAGELAPVLEISHGNTSLTKEIRMGTVTHSTITADGYTFVLKQSTEKQIVLLVNK